MTLPDGTFIEYIIDGRNRRVAKLVDGVFIEGFLYQSQLNPVAKIDNTGNMIERYVYAGKGNVPAYIIQGANTYRIISDNLGSPRIVVDINTGAIAQKMDYDEFGNVILDTNPGFQPFGFAGGLYDSQTGLVRFGVRDYDPETGRWTAKDPIRFAGGDMNLYGYVGNNPVNFVDPWGLLQFPAGFQQKYPKSYNRIKSVDRRITPKMIKAAKKYGQASRKTFFKALLPNTGPQINPTNLSGAFGQFTPNTGSNVIDIDIGLLNKFEQGQASKKLMDATVLHELIHYFDDQDSIDYPGEEGNLFEQDCYGGIINK